MKRDRGFVLLCVLWALALLTLVVVGFGRRAMMEARAAAFELDQMDAMFMARGAVQRGIVELTYKNVVDLMEAKEGRTSCDQRWFNPPEMLKEGGYYPHMDGPAYRNEFCRYIIRDEESRISINASPRALLENVPGLSRDALRTIGQRRGWVRSDEDARYTFISIDELRSIDGITDEAWFGVGGRRGLRDILTVSGDGKVNINTAPLEVLECIPDLSDEELDAIVAHRQGSDGVLCTPSDNYFEDMRDLQNKTGLTGPSLGALGTYSKFDSSFFTITGIATLRQGKVRALCRAEVRFNMNLLRFQVTNWQETFVVTEIEVHQPVTG